MALRLATLSLIVLLAVTACSGSPDVAVPEPSALVKIARATRGVVGETVTVYGSAEPSPGGRASLVAPTELRVIRVDAPNGTEVRAGQTVMRVAPGPTAALDLAKAQSDLRAADAAYARSVRMRADGLSSDADVETARAAKRSAAATVGSLTAGGGVVRAPIAGFVEGLAAGPGDVVPVGTAIGSISGNGAVRARFGIDSTLARTLKTGAHIRISKADGGQVDASVTAVDPVVDAQSRLASIYAALPASAAVRPGQSLSGVVDASGSGEGITVPYAALLDDGGQPYVFIVAKGVAVRRDIETGAVQGDIVSVRKGIGVGDVVVTEGGTALEDGMKVRLK